MTSQIVAIIDKSGSMECVLNATVNGFNKYLNEMKQCQADIKMTLILFSDDVKIIYKYTDIQLIPELSTQIYRPQGKTSLYDAIGSGIEQVIDDGSTVSIFITTDGYDNNSTKYHEKDIKELVQSKQNWNFIFAGVGLSDTNQPDIGINILHVPTGDRGQEQLYNTVSKIQTLQCTQRQTCDNYDPMIDERWSEKHLEHTWYLSPQEPSEDQPPCEQFLKQEEYNHVIDCMTQHDISEDSDPVVD